MICVYMATAVKEISHDAPILVDKYIVGKELKSMRFVMGNMSIFGSNGTY